MGRKLTVNVFLPNPDSSLAHSVAFLAGEELPDWAEDLVGDHVFEVPGKKESKPKGKIPNVAKETPKSETFEIPKPNASIASWKSFAKKAYQIEDLPQNITRDEVIAEILKIDPSLEIEEA